MGGSAMAGLFDRLTRQVLNSLGQRKTTQAKPKKVSQTANRKQVVVMPVKPGAQENKMTTENITVENIPENNSIPVQEDFFEKDDYLLKQIDEFRAKAQQLQKLLITKESKVQELQEIVDEREVKAKELEYLLAERQKKADGITEEVTKQIDSLIDKVSEKMDAIGESLGQGVQDGQKLTERQIEELKDTLSELNAQLEVVKTDLSDKVHSENVQCYRNIADLLKSVEEKLDKANEIEKKVISTRRWTVAVMIFSLMNMAGIVFLALIALGILK